MEPAQEAVRPPGSPSARLREAQWEAPPAFDVPQPRRRQARLSLFKMLVILGPVLVGLYLGVGRWRAYRNREINKYLNQATEQLKHDSYASYKKACEAADKVLELDPTSTKAQACLAYAWAIRWGEHGGGDEARRQAEEHLQGAKKGQELRYFFYSA